MKIGDPTLDQLRIFLGVVEHGSFGGAARAMGRAVSAISYGIAGLEAQLGISVFEREGSRKPVLTPAGEGLLAEARGVTDRVDALLAKTQSLHAGLESSVSIVIDVMVPGEATASVLRRFRWEYPTVALALNIEGLGAVAQCLLDKEAEIAIGGPVIADHPALEQQAIGTVQLIPVAAPDHPLARAVAAGTITPGESRQHLQLVLADRSSLTQGREFSVLSPQTWRLGDLGAKHSLLKEGLGWGNMPRAMVAADLAAGALVELDLPEAPGDDYRLRALWRRDAQPGPAARWLIEEFARALT
ncbi:MAG: LysR family transcriptional regulator [Erythrobacter sp.]